MQSNYRHQHYILAECEANGKLSNNSASSARQTQAQIDSMPTEAAHQAALATGNNRYNQLPTCSASRQQQQHQRISSSNYLAPMISTESHQQAHSSEIADNLKPPSNQKQATSGNFIDHMKQQFTNHRQHFKLMKNRQQSSQKQPDGKQTTLMQHQHQQQIVNQNFSSGSNNNNNNNNIRYNNHHMRQQQAPSLTHHDQQQHHLYHKNQYGHEDATNGLDHLDDEDPRKRISCGLNGLNLNDDSTKNQDNYASQIRNSQLKYQFQAQPQQQVQNRQQLGNMMMQSDSNDDKSVNNNQPTWSASASDRKCPSAMDQSSKGKGELKPLHVNFNKAGRASSTAGQVIDDDEEDEGDTRKKKYLTAKYGQQQMNLIKKRLKIEMWLYEQLQELTKGSKSEAELDDIDIDLDQLLDMDDDSSRRRWLQKTLKPFEDVPTDRINEFIEHVLEQSRLL